MSKMAELYAALTELPDSVKEEMERKENLGKSDFMQGFYRGRAEGLAIGQEEGAFLERERIIKLLEQLIPEKPAYEMPMEYWVQRKLIEQAIALIKGENN